MADFQLDTSGQVQILPHQSVPAAFADLAWARLQVHADNCGFDGARHGELQPWASKRIVAYAQSCGIRPADVPGIVFGRA